MSEHLPECPQHIHWREHFDDYWCDDDCTADCICNRLRDCEQRLWDEAYAAGFNHGRAHGELLSCPISYKHGYKQGVEAAREAVAALPKMKIAGNFPLIDADDAISAIDALLNDSSNNGTKVQGKANDEQA